MYQQILVAIDGSAASVPALNAALALARDLRARLRIVHVVEEAGYAIAETPPYGDQRASGTLESGTNAQPIAVAGEDGAGGEAIIAWSAAGQAVLDAATGAAQAAGLTPETALLRSDHRNCAETIVREASQCGADLIVIGTHGRRGIKRLVMGSVAEGVAHRAPVPILLVRGGSATAGDSSRRQRVGAR